MKAGQKDFDTEKKLETFMSTIGVKDYEVRWLSKEQLPHVIQHLTFEGSALWPKLKELPDFLNEKIVRDENEAILADMVDRVPEAVFHGVYKQAYALVKEEKAVKFLVGHALYISILACTAELAGETKLFSSLIDIVEEGHLPLGPEGNIFYLL